jgi:hypothetical protein
MSGGDRRERLRADRLVVKGAHVVSVAGLFLMIDLIDTVGLPQHVRRGPESSMNRTSYRS